MAHLSSDFVRNGLAEMLLDHAVRSGHFDRYQLRDYTDVALRARELVACARRLLGNTRFDHVIVMPQWSMGGPLRWRCYRVEIRA